MPLTVAERVRRYRRRYPDRVRLQCFISRRTRDQLDRARRHHGKTLAQLIEHAVDLLDAETLPPPAAEASAAARASDRSRGPDAGRDHERTRGLDHGAYRLRKTAHAGVPPPEPLSAPLAPPSSELETILASEMPDLPEPGRAFLRRHGAAIVGPLRDGRVAAAADAARARGLPQYSAGAASAREIASERTSPHTPLYNVINLMCPTC
jgi:hypothetical protein